ncbi:MAG: ThiF family adenylyltransferase [Verrucomicrobiales bacterium]|nr:ThiF family adenylyltransferase [Verrucomicrobiales bacterium]
MKFEPKIPNGSVFKIIGLGGVGSIVARYLALFLGSQNRDLDLVLIDGDDFEPSNATRMIFPTCGNKAATVRDDLLAGFAHSRLSIRAIEEFVTYENIDQLIQPGDYVLLGLDNHASRKMISEYCECSCRDITLVSGGNDGVEPDSTGTRGRGTFGNVQVYLIQNGKDLTLPLTAHHPEIANPADSLPTDLNCTELIASTPQILFANLATASAMLNALWLHLCGALKYSEAVLDIGEAVMRPVEMISNQQG